MYSAVARRFAIVLLILTSWTLASCTDQGGLSPSRQASFDLTEWPDSILVGETRGFQALVLDADGNTVVNPNVYFGTNTQSRAALATGTQPDSAYLTGAFPGLSIVRVHLRPGAFRETEAVKNIIVVLDGMELLSPSGDVDLAEVGDAIDATATGYAIEGVPLSRSGIYWLSKNNVVSLDIRANGDSVRIRAEQPGVDTVTAYHTYCVGSCSTSFEVRVGSMAEAAALQVVSQPSASAAAGAPFAQQPVIRLVDAQGSAVAQANVPVTVAIESGGGTLLGTATVQTNGGGVATFTDLAIGGVAGLRVLRFTSGSLTGVNSQNITMGAGAASQIQVSGPGSVTANKQSSALTVTVHDAYLNPATVGAATELSLSSNTGGTATFFSGDGSTTITGLTLAAGAGSASFRYRDSAAGARTISIARTSGNEVGSAQHPITVNAQVATALQMVTQPSATAAAGMAFGQQPAIRLIDGDGDAVPQSGVTITAAIFSGGGTLMGTATAQTDGSGVASFPNLAIGGTVGVRVLRFTSGSLTAVNSQNVTVTAGPASKITMTGPGSVITNQVSSNFTVSVFDAYDNAATVSAATVLALSSNTGGTATFYLADGVTTIASLTLAAGAGSGTFRYRDTAAGASRTVTATGTSGDAVGSAQHTFAVSGGSARWVGGSSATTNNANNSSSLEVTRPVGVANGHVMVAVVTVGAASGGTLPTITTPSGWTLVRSDNDASVRQSVFHKVVTNVGAEPASYTFTISQNSRFSAGIAAYSGISTSSPIAFHSGGTGSGATITAPSTSAPAGGGTVVSLFGVASGVSITLGAGSSSEVRLTDGGSGNSRMSLLVADDDVTGTTTGSRTANGHASASNIGQIVVLQPN